MPALVIIPDLTVGSDVAIPPAPRNGKPPIEAVVEAVGGLPGGMQSGAPSVAMFVRMPDGGIAFAETSLALFLAAADALRAKYGTPEPVAN